MKVRNYDVITNFRNYVTTLPPVLYILTTGCKEPRTGTPSIFNIIPLSQHLQERRSELLVRGSDRSCGMSNSPTPLTTPRLDKWKIQPEIEILKANEPAPYV
jgi:hypothetical protein